MWRKFKFWLCRDELERMQKWVDKEWQEMYEEFVRRDNFFHLQHQVIIQENEHLHKLIVDREMLKPVNVIVTKSMLESESKLAESCAACVFGTSTGLVHTSWCPNFKGNIVTSDEPTS